MKSFLSFNDVKCLFYFVQFFVSEVDLGRNRAEASQDKLAALNKYVKVESCGGSLSDALITKHGVQFLIHISLMVLNLNLFF